MVVESGLGRENMENTETPIPEGVDPEQAKKMQAFAQMMKNMAKQQRRDGLIETDQVAAEDSDDLNILPMPVDQKVLPEYMIWTWEPVPHVTVSAYLFRKSVDYANFKHIKGDWHVTIETISGDNPAGFFADEAKLVGQALISAWNYEKVWKLHAGTFMERQLFTDEDGKVKVAGKTNDVVIVESDDVDDEGYLK